MTEKKASEKCSCWVLGSFSHGTQNFGVSTDPTHGDMILEERQKILIVDDKSANLFSLEQILKETDAEIIRAQSGNEALALSLNNEFALALIDVQMPGMDGYELAEWMRSEKKTRSLPIIFISAEYNTDYHIFKGYEAGAVDYLVKPYDPIILLNKVKVFLELEKHRILLKQSRQRLALANEKLELRVKERTKDLEQFAFVVSHDLQEPLRMVSGFVQLLEKRYKGKLDESADQYIHFAVDGANRMREMISDILKFSRIGRTETTCQWVSLDKVFKTVLSDLALEIKDSGATVSLDQFPRVWGNRVLLCRVFQNLISNAVKFKGKDPLRIQISTPEVKDLDEALIPPDALKDGFVVLKVQDNGIGMEQQYDDRIFQIFQRLHGREAYPGTGMGLAICKKIIEGQGGRIWVTSQPNEGTAFYFTLCVSAEKQQTNEDPCDSNFIDLK